jgi:hypothetical protein
VPVPMITPTEVRGSRYLNIQPGKQVVVVVLIMCLEGKQQRCRAGRGGGGSGVMADNVP